MIVLVPLILSSHSLSASSLKILAYFQGENYNDKLGYKVAPAGDVNSDGHADVLVGAAGADKVYLYYGGSPMDTSSDLIFNNIIWGLWNVGDVNNDGFSDYVMGDSIDEQVQLFYGGAVLDTLADLVFVGENVGQYGDNYGSWVSGGEDVNGDGENDLLIAANDCGHPGPYDGRVYLYHGGSLLDAAADWIVTYINTLYHNDVWSAEIIGDVNGDGFADIAVGSVGNGETIPGKVYIFFGGSSMDTVADLVIFCPQGWDTFTVSHFGMHIAPLDDINRDGYDDFVVAGAYPCVYFGSEVLDTLPGVVCDNYGLVACNAGDINYDGYDDLLVGNEGYGYEKGAIYLYFGSKNMDSICDLAIYGGSTVFHFGKSVAGLGDVDGDGVDDFIVGGREGFDPWDKGEAWIFAGDSSLPSDVPEEKEEQVVNFNILHQNYPNPFNSATVIHYTVNSSQKTVNRPICTTLKIYNILGEEVRKLVNTIQAEGSYRVVWDGRNNQGKEVGSGVYFYRLKAGDFQKTKKLLLIR